MLLNTVMEGKTSPCLGHTLPMNNPNRGWGSPSMGKWDYLSARSRRETNVGILWEQEGNIVPCFVQLGFRAVLSMVTCKSEVRDARCHLANKGLRGNDKMEVREIWTKNKSIPLFRGPNVKDSRSWPFPLALTVAQNSSATMKKGVVVFLKPYHTPKHGALFNTWLTNISLVPTSQFRLW